MFSYVDNPRRGQPLSRRQGKPIVPGGLLARRGQDLAELHHLPSFDILKKYPYIRNVLTEDSLDPLDNLFDQGLLNVRCAASTYQTLDEDF
ncbi:hypothetical protein [Trinickia mobilis]|uniref:hypothetical protein n=1 Tax=Trinickia mobilis TaxID=2816356 RepID=UPI001A8EB851|nr:hypothetical protein [Trinickia mobilis]